MRQEARDTPSFLWREVPRRGGGWPRETVLPHSGKPTSLRSSAPSRGRGANDFQGSTDYIIVIRGQELTPPHMPRCSAFLIRLSYHVCPIRPFGAPSPRGEGCDTRIPSSKKAAHHPCEPIRSPSTVIPSAAERSLLHCRHMHTCALTQTTPWCFLFRLSLAHDLPLCKKDPSTSVGMTFKEDG